MKIKSHFKKNKFKIVLKIKRCLYLIDILRIINSKYIIMSNKTHKKNRIFCLHMILLNKNNVG